MRTDINPATPDWPVESLGSVSKITLGGTPSTDVPAFWGGEIPWMSSGEVNRRHIWEVEGRITGLGLASSKATLIEPPAVAIGLAGQGKTRGTAALVHVRLCTNQSIALIKGADGVLDTGYLFHNLDARYEELRARSSGGGRGGLSRAILSEVPIALPPLFEQRRIAVILDTLDDAIRRTARVIVKLQQMKRGLLHDLLTRGVDKDGHLRPSPKEAPHLYKDSPLGHVPTGWRVVPLEECLSGPPRNGYSPTATDEWTGQVMLGLGCLTPDGFHPASLKNAPRNDPKLRQAILGEGDLLLSRSNTRELVGLVGTYRDVGVPCTYPDLMMKLVPNGCTVSNFLEIALRTAHSRRQIQAAAVGTSGTMQKINGSIAHHLVVPLPPQEEQVAILMRIAAESSTVAAEGNQLEKLDDLKRGLLHDLLTGRVYVPVRAETSV